MSLIPKIKLGDALGSMLCGVKLGLLGSPVHCEYFSLSPLGLRISQARMLVSLAGALSGFPKLKFFLLH